MSVLAYNGEISTCEKHLITTNIGLAKSISVTTNKKLNSKR